MTSKKNKNTLELLDGGGNDPIEISKRNHPSYKEPARLVLRLVPAVKEIKPND